MRAPRCGSSHSNVRCRARLDAAAGLAGWGDGMGVVQPPGTRPPAPAPARRPWGAIATLGHVVPRKRHVDVLEAVALLQPRMPELRWVTIGDGPELPALRERARELVVAERVQLLGDLEPSHAVHQLPRYHLMTMPRLAEAFSVA